MSAQSALRARGLPLASRVAPLLIHADEITVSVDNCKWEPFREFGARRYPELALPPKAPQKKVAFKKRFSHSINAKHAHNAARDKPTGILKRQKPAEPKACYRARSPPPRPQKPARPQATAAPSVLTGFRLFPGHVSATHLSAAARCKAAREDPEAMQVLQPNKMRKTSTPSTRQAMALPSTLRRAQSLDETVASSSKGGPALCPAAAA